MDGEGRLRLLDVNPHLVCYLCGGYYVEATTIVECLHSFCKSCIIRYLENNSFCPICDVQIHKAKPYRNLRPDKALQNIVYKLVPDLYRKEMQRRRDFYAKHPEYALYAKPEDKGIELERMIFSPNENISLSLQYLEPQRSYEEWENISISSHGSGPGSPPGLAVPASATAGPPPSASPPPPPARSRYLLCPAQVTVAVLKKFLRLKFELTPSHEVEMMHKREVLTDDLTLMDIAYIYTWKRNSPMELQYRFLEAGRPPPPVPPPSLPPAPWVHPCLRARPPPPAPVPRSIPSVPAAPFAPSTSSTSSVPATPAALVAAAAPTAHAIAELRAASAGPATFATPASPATPTPASTPPAASAFTSLPAPATAPVFTTSSLTAIPSLPATPSLPDPPSPTVPPSSPATSTHPGTCPLPASPKGLDPAASMSFPVRRPVKDMKASSSPAARSLGPGCAAATHKTPSSCKKNADARISASRERSKERAAAAQGAAAQGVAAQEATAQGAAANTGRGDESFHKAPHKEPRREGNPQEGVAPQDIAGDVAKRRPAPSPPRTRPRSPTPQRSPPPPRSPPPTRHKEAEKVVAAADTTGSPSASSAGSPSEAAALDAGKGSPPPPPLTLPTPAATSPPHLLPLSLAPPTATPPAPPRQRPPTPLPPSSPASRISIGLLASLALERKRPAPTAPTASITPVAAAPAGAGSVAKRPRAAPPALVTLKRPPTPVPPRITPGPAPPDGHGKLSAIPRLIQIAPQPATGKRRARPRSPPRAPHDGFGALDLSRARGQPGIATIAQNLARRQMMQQQLQLLHAAASPGASPPPSPLSPLATPRPSPHARPPPHAARPSSLSSSSPSPPADPPRARFGLPPPPPPPPPASAAAAAAAAAAFGDWYNEHLLRYLDNLRRAEMPLPPPPTHPHAPPPHARTPPHSHAAFYQYAAAAAAQAHAGRK